MDMVFKPGELRVGKKFRIVPSLNYDFFGHAIGNPIPATVISINEKYRFFRVEFDHGGGIKSIEAFKYCEEGDLACNLRLCV